MSLGLDRASFNQGKNAQYDFSVLEEEQPTLTAKGPGAVATDSRNALLTGRKNGEQSNVKSRQIDMRGGAMYPLLCSVNKGEIMKIKLDENAIMPTRAHSTDAGLDLYSPVDFWIEPEGSPVGDNCAVIDTGVHIELPKGTVGMLKSKSGLNVKHSIIGEGVIDEGYTGSIKVKLYNLGSLPMDFKRGDKIIQLVIVPYYAPALELVDELEETERGTGGFGSTGR